MGDLIISRLIIAEHERASAWIDVTQKFLDSLKPSDMYLVYRSGRSRVPTDVYEQTLKDMGDQCKYLDAIGMDDDSVQQWLLAHITSYISPNTIVYFLGDTPEYHALRDKLPPAKKVICQNNYRLPDPATKKGKGKGKGDPNDKKGQKQDPESKETRPDTEKEVAPASPAVITESRPASQPQNNTASESTQTNTSPPQEENSTLAAIKGIVSSSSRSISRTKNNSQQTSSPNEGQSASNEDNQTQADKSKNSTVQDKPQSLASNESNSQQAPSRNESKNAANGDRDNRAQAGKGKNSAVQNKPQPTTSNKTTVNDLRDLERAIFGNPQQITHPEREYSALDDSKARTIGLMQDRLVSAIQLQIPELQKKQYENHNYAELIVLLAAANSAEELQGSFSSLFSPCKYQFTPQVFAVLQQQAIHYVQTCEVLYAQDLWG